MAQIDKEIYLVSSPSAVQQNPGKAGITSVDASAHLVLFTWYILVAALDR